MSILTPDLTVEVYNADYRVLSQIPWQEAIRLILRGAVYVIDLHSPAVHIHSPSLVIEHPLSVALREYVHIPHKAVNSVTRDGVLRRDRHSCTHCGERADTVDHVLPRCFGAAGTLVQPGGRVPALQRSQGGPDAAGSRDEDDPRAIRTEAARQVSLCAGREAHAGASLSPVG